MLCLRWIFYSIAISLSKTNLELGILYGKRKLTAIKFAFCFMSGNIEQTVFYSEYTIRWMLYRIKIFDSRHFRFQNEINFQIYYFGQSFISTPLSSYSVICTIVHAPSYTRIVLKLFILFKFFGFIITAGRNFTQVKHVV